MRIIFLICLFFYGCIEISAMDEQIRLKSTQLSECRKEAMDELNTILEIERNFPGFFAQIIVDSLRAASGGVHPIYFGIQASSNTRAGLQDSPNLYKRSLNLDLKNFSQMYDRENPEQHGDIGAKKQKKLFKTKDIMTSNLSILESDKVKCNLLSDIGADCHLDMARSIYEALREIYKNKKSKPAAPKNFFLK